ncbi:MAG: dihydroorotate dehydrogenase electron transfer subunit [Bacillota bacterium]|nr:dihydroorotate dehydrogenase electron transfer subunit [Bacillota bacterium]
MEKKIITGTIEQNLTISPGIQSLKLGGPEIAESLKAFRPGRFVNVYLEDKAMLLPRPLSICRIEKGRLQLVFKVAGEGTAALARRQSGEKLRLSTPLGQGFQIENAKGRAALIGGGVGAAPLVGLAEALHKQGVQTTAVLGFQDQPFLTDLMQEFCHQVLVATDSGAAGFCGDAVELFQKAAVEADCFFACGPRPMLKALAACCADTPLQVSLEERMGCGYGACVGCTVRVWEPAEPGRRVIGLKKVCADGPVFSGQEVVWDEE